MYSLPKKEQEVRDEWYNPAMDYDIKCEKCNEKMYQIPDNAHVQPEGSPAHETNEKIRFQCLNEKCDIDTIEMDKAELEEMGEYNW